MPWVLAAGLVGLIIAGGNLKPARVHANPAKIWVINDNVAAAIAMTSPASIDSALTGNSVTRLPYISEFDAFQTASEGQVAVTSAMPYAGNIFIVVQTDGSPSNVTLNGRGLICTPACDGVTGSFPDSTDYIVAYRVTDTSTFVGGIPATAIQDSVALDSRTLSLVGQAQNMTLSVAKTAIDAGLSTCSITDSTSSPQRTAASATYTDVNNTPLVGYDTAWSSTSTANMLVALGGTASMLQADGITVAATNVACGVSAGSADLQAANMVSGAIQGNSGQVTRSQTIAVTGTASPTPSVPHVSSGGTTTTFETMLSGGIASAVYQVDLFSSPWCGAVSGNAHLGTFSASTDASGNLTLYAIAPASVTPGWVVQATVTDPNSITSPLSACQTVVARTCTDDTTCNGYTDAQKIALGTDPFTFCEIMRADVNMDGKVTLADLATTAGWFDQFIPPAPARDDQNLDGKITLADLAMEAGVFNEPVTACP